MPIGGTVKLTGESEYKKALREITQQLKEVSSESKAVSSQYSATDKSEKALTDQTKALNKQLDTQKERIELMKRRYDELSHSEGVSEDELSKLRTQINNATADMNKTERQIKDLGTQTETTGKRFDGLGETLGKISKAAGVALAAIGTAAVAAGKKMYDMAKQTAAAGDEIDKESQKLGLSAETYQKLNYALDLSGASISDLSKGVKTITADLAKAQNGVEGSTKKFDALGISVQNTDGTFKSQEEVLLETIDALAKMDDETQRNAAAQEIFGKSAQELNPLLNAGADGIKSLMQEAEKFGMVMSNEAVANSAAFNDSLDRLSGTMDGLRNRMIADLLPGLTQITDGFAGLLAGVDGADQQIQSGVQALAESINKVLPQAVTVISSVLQAILKEAPTIFKNLAQSLLDALPDILPVISDAIAGIGKAIIELVPEILKAIPELIGGIVEGALTILKGLWDAILESFFGIESESKKIKERIDDQNSAIYAQADALKEVNPQLADYNMLLSDSGNTLADLDKTIKENEDKITEVIRIALQEQRGLREEDIISIQEYTQNILDAQAQQLEIYRSQQISELRKLQLETETVTQEGAAQHLANTQEALKRANDATEEAYTAQLTIIEQKYKAMGQVGSKAYQDELAAAKKTHDEQLKENQGYYQNTVSLLQEHAKRWIAMDADKWATLANQMQNFNMETDDETRKFGLTMQEWARGFEVEAENYSAALANMDRDAARGFLNMATSVKSSGIEIDDQTKAIATSILNSFDNLPEDMDEAGKQALMGIIYGLEDQIPQLKNASQMSANEIVDTIKEYLGIHSPSTVLEEVGVNAVKGIEEGLDSESVNLKSSANKTVAVFIDPFLAAKTDMYSAGSNMAQGVWQGFSAQEWSITSNVRYMMRRITSSVRSEMQIASPSKVFAQIGNYMAQGLDVGFTDEMRAVTNDIKNAMPTSIDQIGIQESKSSPAYSANNMVDAFKKALSEMKVELDDDAVGGFVDKTVTKLIYT